MTSFSKGAVAILTAGAAVLTVGLGASPASAKASDGFVRGYDKFTDDFDDEGTLSTTVNEKSNATCLWQSILWAEGINASRDSVDGVFGDRTAEATRILQDRWGLTNDGVVGKGTFAEAGDRLEYRNGSTFRGEELGVTYRGSKYAIWLYRDVQGRYQFRDGNGDMRIAGYDHWTCTT
ncbi:peptidoglycan-binding domain-containing protein [Streptomyces sp. MMG1533]|uniref:peptidoglycan-binding domain-containing protein n=1 Tax=Streptomyces sp. MMG1533 TaxID=1415546 RepID=UPI000B0F49B8|nr:peptidoglycan-binding protein [Streptomyces sp. MMG1533]